jgi:predicted exporter
MNQLEPKARRRLAALLVITASLAVLSWKLLRFETSILTFLPRGDQELYEVTSKLADSTLSKSMILALDGDQDNEALTRTATELASRLRKVSGVRSVSTGPSDELQQTLFRIYFQRRYEFADLKPAALAETLSTEQALDARASALLAALSAPDGVLEKQLAGADPLGLFSGFLGRLNSLSEGGPTASNGQYFSRNRKALLFLEFGGSAFDSKAQEPLLRALEKERLDLAQQSKNVSLSYTGVNVFAEQSERTTKADIQRISTISTALLLGVYLWLFRRPSRLLFPLVPLAVGTVIGVLTSQLVFGHVHVITLAFGSSLIGVAIDFPVHLIAHHDLGAPGQEPDHALSGVLKSLLLAGGTTILGLAALGFAGLPGLTEMAVFAASGVLGGLVSVAFAAPLLGRSLPPSRALYQSAERLHRLLSFAHRNRLVPRVLVLFALLLGLVGVSRMQFERSLAALNQPPAELLATDRVLREAAGQSDNAKLLVTLAPTLEMALQKLEAFERDAGQLPAHQSVTTLLRSAKLRSENRDTFAALPNLGARMCAALERAGFAVEAFAEFRTSLTTPIPVMSAEALAAELPTSLLAPFLVRLEGKVALLSHFPGHTKQSDLEPLLRQHRSTHYFSQKESLDELFASVASRTAWVMGLGFSTVFLLVLARYRDLRKTISALLAPSLSCLATLGALSLANQSIGLLHVLALLLVLSMGEDYGIFLVDAYSSENAGEEKAALVSIALASFSTILSFGMLALSSMPALRAIGLTVAIGDFGSLILAPTSLLLFNRKK